MRESVLEAYEFCEKHDLAALWAYLFANWYAPGRWELWARSAHFGFRTISSMAPLSEMPTWTVTMSVKLSSSHQSHYRGARDIQPYKEWLLLVTAPTPGAGDYENPRHKHQTDLELMTCTCNESLYSPVFLCPGLGRWQRGLRPRRTPGFGCVVRRTRYRPRGCVAI
ncbi:hypothetical protein L202_06769 [Cryptococcus amylolentus CBS 6039]|uniref:Uncharacterized protein n=1 Tax=Cryptococcus amylolentus CBS 6039 TaxID=1295533 RepID=A0A1E3HDD1_9TREE|nr:hypothetical protein L202_06769 [Cryptococcus amylolentus CBS 6039]ODN74353.1 hypothetical protein L202_06769 [Cryptococcus amylolentus CBS 6039]